MAHGGRFSAVQWWANGLQAIVPQRKKKEKTWGAHIRSGTGLAIEQRFVCVLSNP